MQLQCGMKFLSHVSQGGGRGGLPLFLVEPPYIGPFKKGKMCFVLKVEFCTLKKLEPPPPPPPPPPNQKTSSYTAVIRPFVHLEKFSQKRTEKKGIMQFLFLILGPHIFCL